MSMLLRCSMLALRELDPKLTTCDRRLPYSKQRKRAGRDEGRQIETLWRFRHRPMA